MLVKNRYSHYVDKYYVNVAGRKIAVESFVGKDYGLSRDYEFTLQIMADQPLKQAELIGKKTKFLAICGVVTSLQGPRITPDGKHYSYTLIFNSPLHRLKKSRNNRVFLQKNIIELIAELLKEFDYKTILTEQYKPQEMIIQYDETDYEFLLRNLSRFGLFFAYCESQLIITDNNTELSDNKAVKLETAYPLTITSKLLPQSVKLREYNPNTPEQELIVESSQQNSLIKGYGCNYLYGENYATYEAGQMQADIQQQAIDWQRYTIELTTDCSNLLPGQKLTITDHPVARYNQEYRILNIKMQGDQSAGQIYHKDYPVAICSELLLIPADIIYRHPIKPGHLNGTLTARIDSAGGEYAYLDEQGRYRIRFPYDLDSKPAGAASSPVRLLQPSTGINYGTHFPLQKNTEVIFACINGDINRPIILGVVPNADAPSPVTAYNNSQHIIRTKHGNQLLINDKKNHERINFTAAQQNKLNLGAKAGEHAIQLISEQGGANITAKTHYSQQSETNNILQVGKDHVVTVENAQKFITENQDIILQSGQFTKIKANNKINITSGKNMNLKSSRDILINTHQAAQITAKNLIINSKNGDLYLTANNKINLIVDKITIAQSGAKIEINQNGNITIQANQIDIKTKHNNLQAQQVRVGF